MTSPALLPGDLLPRVTHAHERLVQALLAERGGAAHWTGELSSSALSTAVATIALGEVGRQRRSTTDHPAIEAGLRWLADHGNPDGGWGDTVRSRSNLSTTALVWAAFGAADADEQHAVSVDRARSWIERAIGPGSDLVTAIESRYGNDRTFSIPIVLTLALSGRLGPGGWSRVRPLPFELAALPRSWFGALRLPVVSYALPALIALGQAIHRQAPSPNPVARALRDLTRHRTLSRLEGLQPANGGFLEATPLTAFVTMSLASMGLADHPVLERGAGFLRASVRLDGSWPIDTNLATWTTTLALKALAPSPDALSSAEERAVRSWILGQQYRSIHPYTGAAPGGWAWTDLPGGVPDADDTAGALVALGLLDAGAPDAGTLRAAALGVQWLLGLQNGDGGIPTFCRGWGTLPFDRSAPDLTAHALRAWSVWAPHLPAPLQARISKARKRGLAYLARTQRSDGAWVSLWFGNEHAPGDENPVHGTSQVLTALAGTRTGTRTGSSAGSPPDDASRRRGLGFLLAAQRPDGGWGGSREAPPSVEETAWALTALTSSGAATELLVGPLERGTRWLLDALDSLGGPEPAPVGLYFARLWYFERLYPLIHATEALGRIVRFTAGPEQRTTAP